MSRLGTIADSINEDLKSNPQNYIQPTVFKESYTNKKYVNPDFVKLYGNPYNKKNKTDIYLENQSDYQFEQKSEKSLKEIGYEIREQYFIDINTSRVCYSYVDSISCHKCSAYNWRDSVYCWHCSNNLTRQSNYGQN